MRCLLCAACVLTTALATLAGTSCGAAKSKNAYDVVVLCSDEEKSYYILTNEEREHFLSIADKSPVRKAWINEAPELVLQGRKWDEKGVDEFSVYITRGLIYSGFFLDAFSERMHDRKSKCIALDDSATSFLLQLAEKQKAKMGK